jgi:predicted TIM-barrel fold metal-dependent hydrolase
MLIIDAHTHIFPDDTAARILENTSKTFNVPVYGKGTAADLLSQMDRNGITYAVVHMIAPTPASVHATNSWLINLRQERFIKFGTIHPRLKNPAHELDRLKDHNIRGVKLQPEVQEFTVDDRAAAYHLYEALAARGMTVMFHVGGNPKPLPHNRSKPHMIRTVAQDFPELKIIAAHLGGNNMWDSVYDCLAGLENVYMETSLSYGAIAPALAHSIIVRHGHDRIFFGTDYPFAPVEKSVRIAQAVPFLNNTEKEDILGRNAFNFYLSSHQTHA